MNRRKFLKIVGALTTLSFLSFFALPGFEMIAGKMIKKDLSKLNIDNKVITQFLEDAQQANFWKTFSWAQQQYMIIYYLLSSIYIPLPYKEKYKKFKTLIVEQFLLSTDFFFNKMDPNKEIKYVTYYNPYKKPCAHPFSNAYYNNL